MSESHSRRRLGVFGYHKKPHAPSEKRVSVETDGALDDAPEDFSEKKEKKLANYGNVPWSAGMVLSFTGG